MPSGSAPPFPSRREVVVFLPWCAWESLVTRWRGENYPGKEGVEGEAGKPGPSGKTNRARGDGRSPSGSAPVHLVSAFRSPTRRAAWTPAASSWGGGHCDRAKSRLLPSQPLLSVFFFFYFFFFKFAFGHCFNGILAQGERYCIFPCRAHIYNDV